MESKQGIQYAFFKLKWNIVFLGRFSVNNENSQSPHFNVFHDVKIFSSAGGYIHGSSIINVIKAEFASAKKLLDLFVFVLEELDSCTRISNTEKEIFLAYNVRN